MHLFTTLADDAPEHIWCYEWVRFYRFTKHDSTKTGARKIIIKTIIDRGCNHLHACKI